MSIKIFIKFFLLLILLSMPVTAQEVNPDDFPTLIALDKAIIPPRDRVELARQIFGVTSIEPPPAIAVEYQLGDRKMFSVLNDNEAMQVEAELRAIGETIYLWVDVNADIENEDAQALADAFDAEIYNGVRELWGSEATPGIDNDPRVFGLFAYGLGNSLAAYYSSEHSYPSEVVTNSNEHEMFIYNLDTLGTAIDTADVESTTAHEFQHMIRANIDPNADTWMNEGFSMFTELYLGYDSSNWAAYTFIDDPGTQLNTWAEDGPTAPHYGAAMLFITYFYERYGIEAVQNLSADGSAGLDSFDNTLKEMNEAGVNEFFADWVLANYLRDSDVADGRYDYELIDLGSRPYVTDSVREYPYDIDARAAQYSTDYYRLRDLPTSGTLEIQLDAPDTVQLLPIEDSEGQFWYSNRADDSSLTLTHAFDLTGVESATLDYRVWYHLEHLWDYGYVMVSEDNGNTWETLETSEMTGENPYGNGYGVGYSGASSDWVEESISLDEYAGKNILVRFWVIHDDAVNQHGMAIDDVRIDAIGYSSDFEANNGGWQTGGWVLTDNRLPQEIWVQAMQIKDDDVEITRWLLPADEPLTLPLSRDIEEVVLAVSPFAPLTTVPMLYSLSATVSD